MTISRLDGIPELNALSFAITPDDMAALSLHARRTNPQVRRLCLRTAFMLSAVALVVGGVSGWSATGPEQTIATRLLFGVGPALVLALTVGSASFFPPLVGWMTRATFRRSARLQGAPDRDGYLLWLSTDGLYSQRRTGTSLIPYPVIRHVDETRDHVFIFTDQLEAFILPKAAIEPGALYGFLSLLRFHAPHVPFAVDRSR